MISKLKGYRTHIVNIVTGLSNLGLVVGIGYDPEAVMAFIDQFYAGAVAVEMALFGLIAYFREQGKKA